VKILMVSPYPPLRDGIGKYAAQEVADLKKEGHEVKVLSPVPCAAHYVDDLRGGLKLLRIRKYARGFDKVIMQYQPSHYHRRPVGISRILTSLGMFLFFRGQQNLTVVCHEIEYPDTSPRVWIQKWFERLAWKKASNVVFHTQREIDEMQKRLGLRPPASIIRAHGTHFKAAVKENRDTARLRLGLAPDTVIFLCIGFIQPHKGFDRAIEAFRLSGSDKGRLYIVGSTRVETPKIERYLAHLHSLAATDPRVEVKERALTDEEFDRWIIASDFVVLPYRESWSSGVFERAKLLGRPVIVSDIGGISEQAREEDVVVRSDEELARVIATRLGTGIGSHEPLSLINAKEAQELVYAEAQKIKMEALQGSSPTSSLTVPRSNKDPSNVDEALVWLGGTAASLPVVVPSSRRFLGPVVTAIKRALRRMLRWYVEDPLQEVQRFHAGTILALRMLSDEVERLRALSDTPGPPERRT
jgi:glycosyltransferase involved in cell wall biosynthesis